MGKFFTADIFRIGYIYGQGISSMYQDTDGLNLDAAPKSLEDTDLELVHSISFWASYNRYWGRGFRSVFSYSLIRLFSDFIEGQYDRNGNGIYEFGQYASANITRTNDAGITYGLEFLWGSLDITEKSAVAGRENAINKRLQFTVKYDLEYIHYFLL